MPLFSEHISNMYYSGTPSYSAPYSYSSSVSPLGTSFSASYLNPGGNYSTHSSLGGYSRAPLSRWTPSSGRNYSPLLSTISERGTSSPMRINSPRRVHIPKRAYATSNYTPRPININTADIDVSRDKYRHKVESPVPAPPPPRASPSPDKENGPFMPRVDGKPETGIDSSPGLQRSTIKRGRTVVRLHTVKRKERDSPRKPQEELSQSQPEINSVDEKIAPNVEENEPAGPVRWREKLSEDLTYKDKREKKTLGAKLVEKFIVKDKDEEVLKDRESIEKSDDSQCSPTTPLPKNILPRSPDRRCSVELLAEQANLLDSLIRNENLSIATLDLSKIGINNESSPNVEPSQFIKRRKSDDQDNPLQTTKSDHSLHQSLKSFKDYKDPKHFTKKRSLKKSSSGGTICRLDSITEFPREPIELPAIEENRLSVKRNSIKTKQKLKPKITSSVEISDTPKSPLKFRVDVTVEEKPRTPKKEITFSSVVDETPNKTESILKTENELLKKKGNLPYNSKKRSRALLAEEGDSASPEPEDGNFWDKIGKRETVYLIKRKQFLENDKEKHRRALFWFPEEEEASANEEAKTNNTDTPVNMPQKDISESMQSHESNDNQYSPKIIKNVQHEPIVLEENKFLDNKSVSESVKPNKIYQENSPKESSNLVMDNVKINEDSKKSKSSTKDVVKPSLKEKSIDEKKIVTNQKVQEIASSKGKNTIEKESEQIQENKKESEDNLLNDNKMDLAQNNKNDHNKGVPIDNKLFAEKICADANDFNLNTDSEIIEKTFTKENETQLKTLEVDNVVSPTINDDIKEHNMKIHQQRPTETIDEINSITILKDNKADNILEHGIIGKTNDKKIDEEVSDSKTDKRIGSGKGKTVELESHSKTSLNSDTKSKTSEVATVELKSQSKVSLNKDTNSKTSEVATVEAKSHSNISLNKDTNSKTSEAATVQAKSHSNISLNKHTNSKTSEAATVESKSPLNASLKKDSNSKPTDVAKVNKLFGKCTTEKNAKSMDKNEKSNNSSEMCPIHGKKSQINNLSQSNKDIKTNKPLEICASEQTLGSDKNKNKVSNSSVLSKNIEKSTLSTDVNIGDISKIQPLEAGASDISAISSSIDSTKTLKQSSKKDLISKHVELPNKIIVQPDQISSDDSSTNNRINEDILCDVTKSPIVIESENIPIKNNEVKSEPLLKVEQAPEEVKKAENISQNEVKEETKQLSPKPEIKLPPSPRKPVKEEPALRPLIATPRPLQKKVPQIIHSSSSEDSSSEEESSDEDDEDESESSEDSTTEFFECENNPDGRTSTGSNDSGFDSSAPTSPAGFMHVKKGGESPGTSSGSAPGQADSTDILEQELEQSTAYGLFRKTGRFTPPARSIPRFRKYTIDDFQFIKVLGKGSFGKVLLAELRDTEYYYAVKCLKKDVVLEDDDVECTLIERKVLALGTNHPYLCHLFATFQTDSHLFFVMEYLNGGDLMFHIQQSGRFPEARARFYAAEIVSGLKFLHKRGIVYRDLKLDNILLDFDGHVRIADFGMCKLQIYLDKTADTFCGTPDYMAPEIIKGLKYNQTVDWWSFGVLLYEMLIGQSPFSGCDEDELFWSICNEMPSYPRFLSQEALAILTRLLDKDARTRLGGTECMHGDIRDQAFFHPIHWDRLERRDLEAPFKPRVRHPMDTQYFDRAFTGERPRLTAVEPQVLRSMDQEPFRGFSYTNPNATDR